MQHLMRGSTVLAIKVYYGILLFFLQASDFGECSLPVGSVSMYWDSHSQALVAVASQEAGTWIKQLYVGSSEEGWSKAQLLVSNSIVLDEVGTTFCAALFQQWRMYCLHAKGSCQLDKLNRWKLMWLRCGLCFWVCWKLKRNDLLRFYRLRRSVITPFLLSAWVQEWQKQYTFLGRIATL